MQPLSADALDGLAKLARDNCRALPAPFPGFVLFFSASDGKNRATVVHAVARTFDEAWRKGLAALRDLFEKRRGRPRWVRIDWVEKVTPSNWRDVRALLSATKRNYFRFGLALDADFGRAFLEQELNANAMLYGGNAIENAVLNERNFGLYAASRFPGGGGIDFGDEAAVFILQTGGAFRDDDGSLSRLGSSGLDAGRRTIDALGESDVLSLIRRSSGYLAKQVLDDGAFVYGYHPCFGRRIDTYNTLRHASTTYAMVEAWEVTGNAELKAAIDRALRRLCDELIWRVVLPDGSAAAFLVDTGGEIKLGGNAVAILALAKYSTVARTDNFNRLMAELAEGICFMQDRRSGAFRHVLAFPSLETKAAFHWLAYCANELTRVRPKDEYFRFALRNVADYLDFVANRITIPTLLELMTATREIVQRIDGLPQFRHLLAELDLARFESALEKRARYLLNGHFWPEFAMFFRNPERIEGSFFIRHHAFRVRIDDVEHYLSGFIAYRRYLQDRDAFRRLVREYTKAGTPPPAGSWSAEHVAAATGGRWVEPPPQNWAATGLSIFAPAMQPGNLVVVRTGGGKVGMLPQVVGRMRPPPAGVIAGNPSEVDLPGLPLLAVEDAGEAVLAMGRYARDRMTGKVIGVTGSAGKTTTVAMTAHALCAWGPVRKSAHNANLPHGVAWNLASIPWDTPHVVLELAVGRMAVSARMARPDVAIFMNVMPAHLGEKSTLGDIARTKSAIFLGMSEGSCAVINRDMSEWETVLAAAKGRKLDVIAYGSDPESAFRLLDFDPESREVHALLPGRKMRYRIGASGRHMALNSLAVLAAVSALGHDLEPALEQLSTFAALPGRGEELRLAIGGRSVRMIDDAYNANPGSMTAALDRLDKEKGARRIAVLGEMAELGPEAAIYHTRLARTIECSSIDKVYVTGALYADFWRELSDRRKGVYADSLEALRDVLNDELAEGDVVLFKGSHSTRVHELVSWFRTHATAA
ncbi:MAG: UDP-N-acetylmuramoyl-tripeptide--D-alanyl-D-alanine ligase [Rhizobiales bacterium]|nr:UDP-N-acetylmuramoyl-tripeptide--D-alanyl-D-alanine ligase [Hyphomicrobiales bacterium]